MPFARGNTGSRIFCILLLTLRLLIAIIIIMNEKLHSLIKDTAAVLKNAGAREVFLFGSAADDGAMHQASDVDLAVRGLPPHVFFKAMSQAQRTLGHTLDLIDLDEPSLFSEYLQKKGKLHRVA